MNKFELWQQSECAIFGCTIEEHNKLLEIAGRMEALGFPNAYDAMKNAIDTRPDFEKAKFNLKSRYDEETLQNPKTS